MHDGLLQRLRAAHKLHHTKAACDGQHRVGADLQGGQPVSLAAVEKPTSAHPTQHTDKQIETEGLRPSTLILQALRRTTLPAASVVLAPGGGARLSLGCAQAGHWRHPAAAPCAGRCAAPRRPSRSTHTPWRPGWQCLCPDAASMCSLLIAMSQAPQDCRAIS